LDAQPAATKPESPKRTGPLSGLRVVQVGGIGPVPFCGMLLADMGAEVLCLERPPRPKAPGDVERSPVLDRSRRLLCLDLKDPGGCDLALALVARADALLEGYRPGVMERLGLGPEPCLARNPRLVYGRMTGWGQDGPLAERAGHDIDYVALSGVLHAIGPGDGPPVPPLNLVGDFGGGGAMLAVGVLGALWEAQRSGTGQVVDAAMVDGAAAMAAWVYGERAAGRWRDQRAANVVDGGRPFYGIYETRDGKFIAIGAIEARFFRTLCEAIGLDPAGFPDHTDPACWPRLRARLAEIFATRSRDYWCRILDPADACAAPVLSFAEAPGHPHNRMRQTFVEVDGVVQPAPAPRFGRTPLAPPSPPPQPGAETAAILADWGVAEADAEALVRDGVVV
jgi:alpha-methylacyl-CoA racemase